MPDTNDDAIQQKVEAFLKTIGIPGFIVFAYKKDDNNFQIVSSYNKMPKVAAVKGLSKVLYEFVDREL